MAATLTHFMMLVSTTKVHPFKAAKVKFNNGQYCPMLGLGTWKAEPNKVSQAVKDAIDAGYRHIDCAYIYGNEKEIGEAIAMKMDEGVVHREDLFITNKLWNTFHREDLVLPALQKSLDNLGLSYIELYLIHWPVAFKEGDELYLEPRGDVPFSNVSFLETWRAMEKLVDAGLVKSIGLSNFNISQIEEILKIARIKPVANQVECHPYLNQKELKDYCDSKNIKLIAYGPLGSPYRPRDSGDPILLEDPIVNAMAIEKRKTPAQILIKYQLQRGVIVIPKSTSKERIISNKDVFDFTLAVNEMKTLNSLTKKQPWPAWRYCRFNWARNHKDYPFEFNFTRTPRPPFWLDSD